MNRLWVVLLLGFLGLPAMADDSALGYAKTVTGNASVTRAGTATKIQPGTPIRMGDTLKTSAGSSLGITFKDNTVMSFGPDTEVTVDEYLYDPGKGDLKLNASVSKGTLEYFSGVIAKLKPQAVAVKTPTGTIGVRGTHFLVKVDDMSAPATNESPAENADSGKGK
jgi:hypothetical protein